MASEPLKKNSSDAHAPADDIGRDPDTVRAAKRKREQDQSPEREIMDDPDMGEDEHPDDGQGDDTASAPSEREGVPRGRPG